ncbi:3-hydroxyisobutyrate dehydrogenase [Noviherbaspirillum humi]|uniref:3-hydroxyisobutyrate dehydrogenase n=1 Tax=Noviherbaspirillum humi TaxID=1688639 RepID=A0A239F777_9BURK|nr:NAD(P)-dependent oxidoreductase [Noviherbaspirillum humi]SNS52143.1 3-hydroxyisobutyrate dehydrogenase [Noviherbaspirillum humi]
MEIGFIGLGSMGYPMAENLLKAGHALAIWNRSREKGEGLASQGARQAGRPADAVSADGVAITMVADDAALESVVLGPDGILEKLGPGGVHVSMSTISPALSARLAELHRARGSHYVAAPVFGRPDAAAAKMLFVLCAGPAAACERVRPALEAMGQKVFPLGEEPVHANIIKLGGNFMIMSVIEAMAEAMTLGEKHGVPREKTMEVLTQSIFPAPLFVNYGKQIAAHAYRPARFKLSLGLKDANLVLGAAARAQVPMPLAALMQGRYLAAVAKGRADLDWTAAALNVAEDAGLDPGDGH